MNELNSGNIVLKTIETKAELLQEGTFFLVHLFARDKTKPAFIISVLKVEYYLNRWS